MIERTETKPGRIEIGWGPATPGGVKTNAQTGITNAFVNLAAGDTSVLLALIAEQAANQKRASNAEAAGAGHDCGACVKCGQRVLKSQHRRKTPAGKYWHANCPSPTSPVLDAAGLCNTDLAGGLPFSETSTPAPEKRKISLSDYRAKATRTPARNNAAHHASNAEAPERRGGDMFAPPEMSWLIDTARDAEHPPGSANPSDDSEEECAFGSSHLDVDASGNISEVGFRMAVNHCPIASHICRCSPLLI